MRVHDCQKGSYKFRIKTALTLLAITALITTVGCRSPKASVGTDSAVTGNNTNSRGLPKLTASEVGEKIKAVQASTSIPESAKPKAIETIRAQGEP